MEEEPIVLDDEAYRMLSGIEQAIVRLHLDSQGQFVALINAIEMQLDSGDPNPTVVRLLSEALLTLADAKQLPRQKLKLDERFDTLNKRIASYRTP
jgi:hypothetical protein